MAGKTSDGKTPDGKTPGDNACDAIARELRREILEGELAPGFKLRQEELARRFGISRTPVRDALRRLEAEGLVTIRSSRHATVPTLDLDEFIEVYQIRETLESLAARLAAPRMTEEILERIEQILGAMEEASRRGDVGSWVRLDYRFHHALLEPGRNKRLLRLVEGFWNSTHHFRRAYCRLPRRVQGAEKMHRRLLEAARARDEEMLGLLTRAHIQDSLRGILEAQQLEDGALEDRTATDAAAGGNGAA